MSRERPLRGGCSCGRNTYIIEVPPNATEVAQVFFDRSGSHRRSLSSPLSAWLRVPLSWYHSTTYAFFDDETHSSIRRVYTSPLEANAKRHFCGFCGTPLSYWSEEPPSEAEYISLTLGSLSGGDLTDLDELGLLPKEFMGDVTPPEVEDGDDGIAEPPSTPATTTTIIGRHQGRGDADGLPWFENLLHGSSLGRVKRSRGEKHSRDGRLMMEWEIIELLPDEGREGDAQSPAKRKIGEVDSSDAVMEETH